jgi:hypothetical protein
MPHQIVPHFSAGFQGQMVSHISSSPPKSIASELYSLQNIVDRHASHKRTSQGRASHRRASRRIYLPKLPAPSHPGPINHDEFLAMTTSAHTLRDRVALEDRIHTRLVAGEAWVACED